MTRVVLDIKMNNCATNDPCAVCGARTDPVVGPELFLSGTWGLACYQCGAEHAPALLALLGLARRAENYWGPRGEGHAPDDALLHDLASAADAYGDTMWGGWAEATKAGDPSG